MPTIAELEAQTKELESQLKSLSSKPDFSHLRGEDGEAPVEHEWSDSGESGTIVFGETSGRRGPQLRLKGNAAERKSLKRHGYVPASQNNGHGFKSVAHMIREGIESDNGRSQQFRDRYSNHMKSLKAVQGMSEGVGADGGFGVIPEWNLKIREHVYDNNLLERTDGYTVQGNSMTFLANAETSRVTGQRHGGLYGSWIGEGNLIPASKPTIREIQMRLQKLGVVVYLTDELLKDNDIALEQYVTRKAGDEFKWLIGNSLFNGTGSGMPLGIQNAPSLLAIAKASGQSNTTIVAQNIITMQNRLFAPYMANASWYVNQDTVQQLMQLTLATGTYSGQLVYMPPTGLSNAPYGTLNGRPVEPIEFAKTLGAQGDITLADLSQILSITKGGIEQAVSMHIEFLTDQLALRFTMRLNAQPWENSPITPANGTNTQSSFITLQAR